VAATEMSPSGAQPPGGGPGSNEPGVEWLAVPGVPAVLDGGVPWVRTGPELDREWARMMAAVAALGFGGERGPGVVERQYAALDGAGRAVLGVFSAARWSVGEVNRTPITERYAPVTGSSLTRELNTAERCSLLRVEGAAYATGVLAWLMWMTGERDTVVYPTWDPNRPA
jgi:hypothetical protein